MVQRKRAKSKKRICNRQLRNKEKLSIKNSAKEKRRKKIEIEDNKTGAREKCRKYRDIVRKITRKSSNNLNGGHTNIHERRLI